MIKNICKDIFILSKPSLEANIDDLSVGNDLADTLIANSERCVGMAANMIYINKKIIAFSNEGKVEVMYNPEIIKMDGKYITMEGCLSLDGERQAVRYKSIKVKYQNEKFQTRIKSFSGFTAQIIQHEIDHTNGIVI